MQFMAMDATYWRRERVADLASKGPGFGEAQIVRIERLAAAAHEARRPAPRLCGPPRSRGSTALADERADTLPAHRRLSDKDGILAVLQVQQRIMVNISGLPPAPQD
jgi:hypothetical protein